jgi:cellobiose epimerase
VEDNGVPADASWAARIRAELTDNILNFWMTRALDRDHGGFFGQIEADGRADPGAPRASVMNTRILWSFAAATRRLGNAYRETADWACAYVLDKFWDRDQGGLFWMLDADGTPISDRKQTYGQAFGLYALAEYVRATGSQEVLETAKTLFRLIEAHARDAAELGYLEALDHAWQPLADMRLSDKDMNCPKSMNTHLHVLEAYSNLLRVWRGPLLEARQGELIALMLTRIFDPQSGHLRLFFAPDWTSLSPAISYGHDIEASWLLVEAAEVLGDSSLLARARATALKLASAVLAEGVDGDGSVFYETAVRLDAEKHWWVQAEALVGFFNAWQLSGDERFRQASCRVWDYIEAKVVNRVQGEWHARLTRQGVPLTGEAETYLAGPWKCPYHNARACFEMLSRLHKA